MIPWRSIRLIGRTPEYTGGALVLATLLLALPNPLRAQDVPTTRAADGKATAVDWTSRPFAVATGGEAPSAASAMGPSECVEGLASGYACSRMHLQSFLPIQLLGGGPGVGLNDVWGWQDAKTGRRYAIVGRTNGTAFVDVTYPDAPVYVGNLPSHGGRNSSWRDIKVYQDHAYIVADAQPGHGLQVFDLRTLRGVTTPTNFQETGHYFGFGSAHNIAIDEETGFAFVVGASAGQSPSPRACAGGLVMLDLAVPADPRFAGCFNHPGTGRALTGYTHDAQCVVYRGPDTRFTGRRICFGSNETALSIADVTNASAPVPVGLGQYPGTSYAHQGWLSEDQRYFFLGDELDELNGGGPIRTLIFDVSKLDDPEVAGQYFSTRSGIDHNMYTTRGRLYQANYKEGIRVLDVSDPERPEEIAWFDTTPTNGPSVWDGTWSVYPYFDDDTVLASSIGQGLFVLSVDAGAVAASTDPAPDVPASFRVGAAWPNPFTEAARIPVTFDETGTARAELVDALGRVLAVVFDGPVQAGTTLDLAVGGSGLPPGSYRFRVSVGGSVRTVTLVRSR